MVFLPVIIFVLGLLIGSFLNVVILRMHTGRSFVKGKSICPRCGRKLRWFELVPVVSFLALRGRCRTCHEHISFQYPIVELLTGFLFVLFYIKAPLAGGFSAFSWAWFVFMATIASVLIVITVYDIRHKIIPDGAVYTFILLALISVVYHVITGGIALIFPLLIAGVVVALPFFLIWFFSKGKFMGFGDVKLALGMGWLLGLSQGFTAVIFGFWIGGIFGLFLIALSHRYSMKSEIPLAPFLIAGLSIVGIFGITLSSLFPLWH
ncbi:MAG TPA: prepilin peptidase [Candidatus Paceibacterota bacterium]|nr:prepilin peptidase [Candidatus Paceibacterota bacterium]